MRVEILGSEKKSFDYVEIKDDDNNASKVDINGAVNYQTVEVNIGMRGRSAYEIARKNGFIGTEEEWLLSLSAYGIALDHGFIGTEEEWLDYLKVDLNITPDDKNKLLTNDGDDTYWVSIEDRLNSETILWDLGNF